MLIPVFGYAPGMDTPSIADCLSDTVHDAQITPTAAAWWDIGNDALQSDAPYNLIVYAHDVLNFLLAIHA